MAVRILGRPERAESVRFDKAILAGKRHTWRLRRGLGRARQVIVRVAR